MVVVVHVEARVARAAFGDEVDQHPERALLAPPVVGPDLRVPGESRLVGLGRVDDAEQVLQPELPAVLGVIPCSLDIEEQVPVAAGSGNASSPWLATRAPSPSPSRSGSRSSYRMTPSSSLAT
jgi:hypothetical protein